MQENIKHVVDQEDLTRGQLPIELYGGPRVHARVCVCVYVCVWMFQNMVDKLRKWPKQRDN